MAGGVPSQHATPGQPGAVLSADQELRRQCLLWAFQTREFCDVPHMHVVNVAQDYYDFIKGQHPHWRDAMRAER